jgi:hypothetical protein
MKPPMSRECIPENCELTPHDRRLIERIAAWDSSIVDTLASLFERVRVTNTPEGHK